MGWRLVQELTVFFRQWLNEEKIVQRLIEQIHPSKDDSVSAASAADISTFCIPSVT